LFWRTGDYKEQTTDKPFHFYFKDRKGAGKSGQNAPIKTGWYPEAGMPGKEIGFHAVNTKKRVLLRETRYPLN
jgi:hypothetical protein